MTLTCAVAAMVTAAAGAQRVPDQSPPPRELPPALRPPAVQPPPAPGRKTSPERLVAVRAAADVDRVRPGQPFLLAIIFDIEPGWHIYWQNPGASGTSTGVRVRGPGNYEIGDVRFTRPRAISSPEGVTYGYEEQTVLFVEVTPALELGAGQASFFIDADWLVCKGICKVGRERLSLTLPTGGSNLPTTPNWREDPVVKTFKARLPQRISDAPDTAAASVEGTTLTVRVPAGGATTAVFFPAHTPGVTYGEAKVATEAGALIVTVPLTVRPGDALGKPLRAAGLVGVGDDPGPAFEFEIPLAAP